MIQIKIPIIMFGIVGTMLTTSTIVSCRFHSSLHHCNFFLFDYLQIRNRVVVTPDSTQYEVAHPPPLEENLFFFLFFQIFSCCNSLFPGIELQLIQISTAHRKDYSRIAPILFCISKCIWFHL